MEQKIAFWLLPGKSGFSPICASALLALLAFANFARADLRVPAFTAYLDPNPDGAWVSDKSGITHWNDPELKVLWFGEFKTVGDVGCSIVLHLPAGQTSSLQLTVGGKSHEAVATGAGANETAVDFGVFKIGQGYQKFQLQSLAAKGKPIGDIDALILSGAPASDAHFNLKPRRNAASVHLAYPLPPDVKVAGFYCQATAEEDPVATYYEVCGWHRGYFGMQVNSPTERRIIFSVWDSGHEGVDRAKVDQNDRVTLVAKGDGVFAGDFGHEGTGGHSHLVYNWKTRETQRFFVTAKPTDATHTLFSGYYFHPDSKKWVLISSWNTPKDGGYLHGLYSFSENFGGSNGHLRRKALYGNQWLQSNDGQWIELTTASFSHDPTGKSDRLDRFMGIEDGQFFLSQGGFIPGFTKFGDKFTRPATGKPPEIVLPPLRAE